MATVLTFPGPEDRDPTDRDHRPAVPFGPEVCAVVALLFETLVGSLLEPRGGADEARGFRNGLITACTLLTGDGSGSVERDALLEAASRRRAGQGGGMR